MTSIDKEEIEKFSQLADQWWREDGMFKELHRMNPLRLGYIKAQVLEHFGCKDLAGLSMLDIGCGGGILTEPLARLGAKMSGIDASNKAIEAAKIHAKQTGIEIDYQCKSAEDLAKQKKRFDVVLAMEIIEHVADVDDFLKSVCKLVKPGGLLFIATINRTVKSYAAAIVAGEYILRLLPVGTHNWQKFLKPSEIARRLGENDFSLKHLQGCSYNPVFGKSWRLSNDLAVNYILVAGGN